MASTDATPNPIKNQAYRVTFPILDADGDLVTGATGLDSEVSKDAGTFADCTNEATEIATASGMYYLELTATEMNADTVAIIVKSSGKTTPIVLYPVQLTVPMLGVNVEQWNNTAVPAENTAGYPIVTVKDGTGTGELDTASGVVQADVRKWNNTAVPAEDTAGYPKVTIKDGTGQGEIALTSGAVDAVTTATNLTNAPTAGDLTATMKASVNTEVLDVLNVDTFAEIGQEAPAATQTLRKMLGYLYKAWRNKKTQTSTTYSLFADDATTVDQKATVSDDGTTTTIGEAATGP